MNNLNQPSSNQNQPPTEQPQTFNPKPSSHGKALLITFAFCILFFVSLTALLLASRTKPSSQLPPSVISTITPHPSPTIDLSYKSTGSAVTANWKTYVSREKYASQTNDWFTYTGVPNINIYYSFKYPNDWKVEDKQLIDPEGNIMGGMSVVLKAGQTCFDVPYDPRFSQNQLQLISQDRITIEKQIPAIRRVYKYYDLKYLAEYCVVEGNKAFILSIDGKKPDIDKERVIDQILSTFKFTE